MRGRALFGAVLALGVLAIVPPAGASGVDGSLDPTFGSGGAVALPLTGEPWYSPVTVALTDGSIVTQTATDGRLRVLPTGEVDDDFPARLSSSLDGEQLQLLTPAPSGGAVAASSSFATPQSQVPDQFRLVGINADGTIDPDFADGGRSPAVPTTGRATSVERDHAGRWVVLHQEFRYDTTLGFREACVLRRFDADGRSDATFGTGGELELRLTYPLGRGPACARALPTATGDIVLLDGVVGVLRITGAGTVDPTWNGGQPVAPLTFGTEVIALGAGGKVLAGGTRWDANDVGSRMELTRLTEGGTVDPTFGSAGRVILGFADLQPPVFPNANVDSLRGIVVQPDGSTLAVGGTVSGTAVARLTTAGTLDPTFGTGGRSVVAPPPPFPDGRGQLPGTGAWSKGRLYLRAGPTLLAIAATDAGNPAVVPEGSPLALALVAATACCVPLLYRRSRRTRRALPTPV